MKKYNNVQLAEDHVAHRQARALERSQIFNQTTTELSIDEKDNIYDDFEKTYEKREQDQMQNLKESQQLQVWKWAHSFKTLSEMNSAPDMLCVTCRCPHDCYWNQAQTGLLKPQEQDKKRMPNQTK
ncbi:hypothetical protein YC2023_107746 [Brassica napus]